MQGPILRFGSAPPTPQVNRKNCLGSLPISSIPPESGPSLPGSEQAQCRACCAQWALFRSALPDSLVLLSDVGLASCPAHCTLLSVSGKDVSTLAQVPATFPGERRTWISVLMPADSDRKLSKESLAVLGMWSSCLADSCPIFPLPLAREFPCLRGRLCGLVTRGYRRFC